MNIETPVSLPEIHYVQKANDEITASVTIDYDGRKEVVTADGNGRLDAVSNALKAYLGSDYALVTYTEHALKCVLARRQFPMLHCRKVRICIGALAFILILSVLRLVHW